MTGVRRSVKLLVVLLLLSGMTSCVGAKKKPARRADALKGIEVMKSATFIPETKTWELSDAGFSLLGRTVIGLHHDILQLEDDLDLARGEAYLDKAGYHLELNKWYRQWETWLTIAVVGVAGGFLAGYLTAL